MNKIEEKWAVFWCELLKPLLYDEIEAQYANRFLKQVCQKEVVFPNGRLGRPSLSTLRRKLKAYRAGGFEALAKKSRNDRGRPRNYSQEIIAAAVDYKKDQPTRSDVIINHFLQERFGVTLPRSTLYRYLKQAGATRLKLGVIKKKVRKRWTRELTHDLWLGDFEEGPYVRVGNDVLPTYLSAFIDCFSRYVVEGRYYLRQNLDVLIDSLLRAWAKHGASLDIYLDNAKVYHSLGLKAACHRLHTRLIYRKPGDPSPGGLIERFFQTAQSQFEAEVRARDAMSLEELNRAFSAWLQVSYHQRVHSETGQTPQERYDQGLKVVRQVDMAQMLESFLQNVTRRVHRDFADVQLNKRFYRVDPKLRGDRVEVRFDPFGSWDKVQIYSLTEQYLGQGVLYQRQYGQAASPPETGKKARYDYLKSIVQKHDQELAGKAQGIDYRKVVKPKIWPFNAFVKSMAQLLGKTGGLGAFNGDELETLKKIHNRHPGLNENLLKKAFVRADHKSIAYVAHEIEKIARQQEGK